VDEVVVGPFLVVCALLVVAGSAKLRAQDATRRAAHAIGWFSGTGVVITLGAIEVGAGIAGALFGGITALLVALVYVGLGFAAFWLWRRAPAVPCSCFGARSAPATPGHVVVNVVAAAIAVLAGVGGSPTVFVIDHPTGALPLVALVTCCTALIPVLVEGRPT
jgi:hypothetical protein